LFDLNDWTTGTRLLKSVRRRAHVTASLVQQVAAVIDIGQSASVRRRCPHHTTHAAQFPLLAAPTQPLASVPEERTREQLSRSELPSRVSSEEEEAVAGVGSREGFPRRLGGMLAFPGGRSG
jgi:hypothetical protein